MQEQTQLNDGSAFRLTTARYYTPSGRCIQKPYKDYKESMVLDDSIKFYTDHGRVVYGGGGISPDYLSQLTQQVVPNGYMSLLQQTL